MLAHAAHVTLRLNHSPLPPQIFIRDQVQWHVLDDVRQHATACADVQVPCHEPLKPVLVRENELGELARHPASEE